MKLLGVSHKTKKCRILHNFSLFLLLFRSFCIVEIDIVLSYPLTLLRNIDFYMDLNTNSNSFYNEFINSIDDIISAGFWISFRKELDDLLFCSKSITKKYGEKSLFKYINEISESVLENFCEHSQERL